MTWTLIQRYREKTTLLDGIWKKALGLAGVIGDSFLQTPGCWEMVCKDLSWRLKISDNHSYIVETFHWNQVICRPRPSRLESAEGAIKPRIQ